MKIKNVFLLAASNIKLALKSALAQFLLLCIFTAIVVLVLNVSAESFSKLFDSGLYETPKMVIEGLLNGGGIDEAVVDVHRNNGIIQTRVAVIRRISQYGIFTVYCNYHSYSTVQFSYRTYGINGVQMSE